MPESKTPMAWSLRGLVGIRGRGGFFGGFLFDFFGGALDGFVQRGGNARGRHGGGEVGNGGFVGGAGDGRGFLVVAAAGEGAAVAADAFEDGSGKGVAELARGDEATIHRVVHESAFEKDAGDFDIANDDEAGALDAAVVEAHLAEHGGVEGRGEGDVFGVAGVAGVLLEVAVTEIFLVHRRHAARGEGERLDAGGAAAQAFVEVDAHKNGVGIFVGEGGAVFERDENIA